MRFLSTGIFGVILAGIVCSCAGPRVDSVRPGSGDVSGVAYYELPLLCASGMDEGREITACIRITLKLDSAALRNDIEKRGDAVSDAVRLALLSAPERALNDVGEYEAVRNSIQAKLNMLPGMAGVCGIMIHELSFRNRARQRNK